METVISQTAGGYPQYSERIQLIDSEHIVCNLSKFSIPLIVFGILLFLVGIITAAVSGNPLCLMASVAGALFLVPIILELFEFLGPCLCCHKPKEDSELLSI